MEQCLHQWFVYNNELRSTCDFHDGLFRHRSAVYEVIRIIDGKPLFFEDHLERLSESQRIAQMSNGPSPAFIKKAVRLLIERNEVSIGNFKLYLGKLPDSPTPDFMAWLMPYFYPSATMYRQGIKVSLLEFERHNPNAKIVRDAFKTEAEALMKQSGAYELLLHHDGFITEGSRSNVFFVKDGRLITAPDEMILKGITRQKLLKIIENKKLPVLFRALKVDELGHAEAAFLCGTSPKVLPISNVDDKFYLEAEHSLTLKIAQAYDDLISEYLEHFSWA